MIKKSEPTYIEVAQKKFDQSVETLTSMLGMLIYQTDFKNEIQVNQRKDAIVMFAQRSRQLFDDIKDEMAATARHKEAEELGEKWEKQLNPYVRNTLVAMGHNYLQK